MPKGIQGMINLNSNMVAPQDNSDNYVDASNWKIVKSKRQLREERKSNYNLNFLPLKKCFLSRFQNLQEQITKYQNHKIDRFEPNFLKKVLIQSSQGHSEG